MCQGLQTGAEENSNYRYFVSSFVELSHSFDLCELDCVSVLESVPDLVERGHDSSVGLLSDASHHGGDRLLSVDVVDDELVAEVGEDLGAKAGSVGDDEGDIVLPGEKKN